MTLRSFKTPLDAVVIGASGGIGRALATALDEDSSVGRVLALSRSGGGPDSGKIVNGFIDIEDEAAVVAALAQVRELEIRPRLVLVASGILHDDDGLQPEKTWRQIGAASMARAFAVNATGPALVAREFLPLFARGERAVFAALSARVGSIGDNRLGGWVAYRASKAALNMVLRTLSIELARRNPDAVIAGLHPGTVDTALSRPFQANVPDGKLFEPQYSARRLLAVVDGLRPQDSGRVFAYDGQPVPP